MRFKIYALLPFLVLGLVLVPSPRPAQALTAYRATLSFQGSGKYAYLFARIWIDWEPRDDRTRGTWDIIYDFRGVDGSTTRRVHRHAQIIANPASGGTRRAFELVVDNWDRKFNEDADRLFRKKKDEIIVHIRVRYLAPGTTGGATVAEIWSNQIQGTF